MEPQINNSNEIVGYEDNSIVFHVQSPGKFVFKINGKTVKIIQEPWYTRLHRYIKKRV